jgi:(p)ppGpp synthase/HD superfamily hydrolase
MVAQTNLQLYNQLRERGMALDDLVLVRRAYELNTKLYSGYFQSDGKPFVSHGVGVASVLAGIGQPAEIIAFGLLHNLYGNGNFGDDRGPGATPERRQLVREAVGDRVESLIERFGHRRVGKQTVDDMLAHMHEYDEGDRILILVDLADRVEKHADLGVLYYGQGDWITGETEHIGTKLIELANALGEPKLAAMLSDGFERAAAQADSVPPELRPTDGRQYATLVMPRSCRPRVHPRRAVRSARSRLRLRTRLRALRPGHAH